MDSVRLLHVWLPWVFIHVLTGLECSVFIPLFPPMQFYTFSFVHLLLVFTYVSHNSGCKTKLIMIFFKDVLYIAILLPPFLHNRFSGGYAAVIFMPCLHFHLCVVRGVSKKYLC